MACDGLGVLEGAGEHIDRMGYFVFMYEGRLRGVEMHKFQGVGNDEDYVFASMTKNKR